MSETTYLTIRVIVSAVALICFIVGGKYVNYDGATLLAIMLAISIYYDLKRKGKDKGKR